MEHEVYQTRRQQDMDAGAQPQQPSGPLQKVARAVRGKFYIISSFYICVCVCEAYDSKLRDNTRGPGRL